MQLFTNNASALLIGAIASGDTTLTVESARADLFPVGTTTNWTTPLDWFKATIEDTSGNIEIVRVGVRGVASGVMSVLLRGQDGTTARGFAAGSVVELRVTAADYQNSLADVGTRIAAATTKATPDDADTLALSDSAASNVLKKLTWANAKATLKTYFDTLYATVTAVNAALANYALKGANTDITSLGNNTSTVYATAGTATAYAIVPNPAITAYTAGQAFQVSFGLASGINPTLQINGIATPPNLVTQQANGTYANVVGIPAGHTSEVRLLSATQALVVTMPPVLALTLATAQATTSGTSIDFAGIPGTAKQITVSLSGVSTNGISPVQVQLGAGAPATTGYVANLTSLADTATAAITSVTTGFVIGDAGSVAASVRTGIFVFTLISANTWVCSAWVAHTGVGRVYSVQGLIVLSGALDRLRLTTVNGTDTFDAGSVNIMYE